MCASDIYETSNGHCLMCLSSIYHHVYLSCIFHFLLNASHLLVSCFLSHNDLEVTRAQQSALCDGRHICAAVCAYIQTLTDVGGMHFLIPRSCNEKTLSNWIFFSPSCQIV